METLTTEEKNTLIAEFMAGEKVAVHHNQYHKNWNELMPIIEKIENLGYEVVISRISCQINKVLDRENPISSMVCGNINKKLEITHTAVIQFIEWYNEQQKNL